MKPKKEIVPVKVMEKEDLHKEVQEHLHTLRHQAESLQKLCTTLEQVVAKNGDVSFIALDDSKLCLEGVSETRAALEKTRRALKARASARMRES